MGQTTLPGPKGKWLLGNAVDFANDPLQFFCKLANEYKDVCQFRLGHYQFVLFSHPDLIQELLAKQHANFKKMDRDIDVLGRFLGRGLLTSSGDFHKKQRGLSQPSFRKKRIKLFADTMLAETQKMLSQWQPNATVDIAQEMMRLTMFIVAKTLFDVEVKEEAEKIGEAIGTIQALTDEEYMSAIPLPFWVPLPRNIKLKRATKEVDAFIHRIIRERRADETAADRGDLLSTLLLAADEDGQRMSDEQLRDELITLFAAGHETTSNALCWAWYLLSQHPEVEAKLHQQIDEVLGQRPPTFEDLEHLPYVEMVIKEALRLYPPAWALGGRTALKDVSIGGHHIAKGTHSWVSPYALHRDPRYYEKPKEFYPEHFSPEQSKTRHKYAFLPFGAGPRVCIGAAYAMTEACLVLASISQRFRLTLAPGQVIEPRPLITLSPKHGIHMALEPRS